MSSQGQNGGHASLVCISVRSSRPLRLAPGAPTRECTITAAALAAGDHSRDGADRARYVPRAGTDTHGTASERQRATLVRGPHGVGARDQHGQIILWFRTG
jgi:hypothetical protein